MNDRYVVNVNPDGLDVVHHNPREECNTDDATFRQHVDHRTAIGLMLKGAARPCGHCFPEGNLEERATLDVQNHIGDRVPTSITRIPVEGTVEKEPTADVEITEGSDTDEAAEEVADAAEKDLEEAQKDADEEAPSA